MSERPTRRGGLPVEPKLQQQTGGECRGFRSGEHKPKAQCESFRECENRRGGYCSTESIKASSGASEAAKVRRSVGTQAEIKDSCE